MGQEIAAMVAGLAVGAVTGVVAGSFLVGATWSAIHSGTSESALAVLSVLATAVPLACGLLTFRAMSRALTRRA